MVTGRRTYSSAILNALQFKQETHAILIGEATGGSPNHYGEVKKFELPNSQYPIRYSTKYFKRIEEDRDTLEPDIKVGVSFEDYQTEKDVVLEKIIQSK